MSSKVALSQAEQPVGRSSDVTRWTQLVIGIICMVMIANLQAKSSQPAAPSPVAKSHDSHAFGTALLRRVESETGKPLALSPSNIEALQATWPL